MERRWRSEELRIALGKCIVLPLQRMLAHFIVVRTFNLLFEINGQ